VDQDVRARESLAVLLQRAGYSVRQAATGPAAVHAALEERPDLAVVEVNLPGMSGHDVCRRLRDTFGETLPILLVSERRTESLDRVAALMIGADDYLVKPVAVGDLLPRISRALVRAKGAPGPRRGFPTT
jgi:DNA-binding response OmpR family regulator